MTNSIPATKFVTPDGTVVYVPMILVTFEYGGQEVRVRAIIDSGADDTIVPASVVAPIGIDFMSLPKLPDAGGAGGSFEVRICKTGTIKWGSTHLMTGFKVAEPGKLDSTLLGRADFFCLFVPSFHWHVTPPYFDLDPIPAPKAPSTGTVSMARPLTKKPKSKRHGARR